MKWKTLYLSSHEEQIKTTANGLTHDIGSFIDSFLVRPNPNIDTLLERISTQLSILLSEPIIIRNKHKVHVRWADGEAQFWYLNDILSTLLLWFDFLKDINSEAPTPENEKIKEEIYKRIEQLYTLLAVDIRLEWWDKIINDWTLNLRRSIKAHVWDLLVSLDRIDLTWPKKTVLESSITSCTEIIEELKKRIHAEKYMHHNHDATRWDIVQDNFRKWDIEWIRDIIKNLENLVSLATKANWDMKAVAKAYLDVKIMISAIMNS